MGMGADHRRDAAVQRGKKVSTEYEEVEFDEDFLSEEEWEIVTEYVNMSDEEE